MSKKVNKITDKNKKLDKKDRFKWILEKDPSISGYNFFNKKVRRPQLEKGFKHKDLFKNSNIDYAKLYNSFFFDLMDKMMFDFIMGDVVIHDKKKGLKFYLHMQKASVDVIAGKCNFRKNLNSKIPMIDFRKTNYSFPKIMMELGYKNKPGALVKVPSYLYIFLLDRIYKGKTHTKSFTHDRSLDGYFYRKNKKK